MRGKRENSQAGGGGRAGLLFLRPRDGQMKQEVRQAVAKWIDPDRHD